MKTHRQSYLFFKAAYHAIATGEHLNCFCHYMNSICLRHKLSEMNTDSEYILCTDSRSSERANIHSPRLHIPTSISSSPPALHACTVISTSHTHHKNSHLTKNPTKPTQANHQAYTRHLLSDTLCPPPPPLAPPCLAMCLATYYTRTSVSLPSHLIRPLLALP